jgi:uncharacterized protein YukE
LTAGQGHIETELAALKAEITNLVGSGFVTDAASRQFDTSYEEFNTGVKHVILGLTGMAKYLTGAAEAMQQTDQQLARALTR